MTKLLCSLWLLLSCLFLQAGPAMPVPGSFVPAWQAETASGRNIDYDVQNEPAKSKCDYDAALMLSKGEKKLASSATRRLIGNFVKLEAARGTSSAVSTATKVGGRAPEFVGGKITESGFLRSAEKYLGSGYKEVSPGRYVSSDGLRQVRFGAHEVRGPQLHGHFEAYDKVGGRVIENTRVKIIPD